jgi:myo-inositol-1(or 4)-monophosphatase
MPITARYIAAQHLARRAGQLAHDLFANRRALADVERPVEEYVTHAARAVSAQIVSKLAAVFPADVFVDEDHTLSSHPDRLWMIEAIGGRRNFTRAIPIYAISIAYAEGGACQAAVVYDPERGEMFHALRDQGAWCEHGGHETRLEVGACKALGQALISVGLDERAPDPAALPVRRELIDAGADARLFGAPALELAQVAAGRLDGFVGFGLDPLGLMGPLLLVEEAGGFVSHVPAAGGIRDDLPVVGCAPGISHALTEINGTWAAEFAVEFPFEQQARGRQRLRDRARATP